MFQSLLCCILPLSSKLYLGVGLQSIVYRALHRHRLLQGLVVATLERFAKPEDPFLPEAFGFTLSNEAIHEFDQDHPAPGREPVPPPIQVAYDVLLFFVDRVYEGKAIERFWFLETVCRLLC